MSIIPVLGLMSGTSFDGIDTSIVFTDGVKLYRTNFNTITPYQEKTQELIKDMIQNPRKITAKSKKVLYLEELITYEHATATKSLIKKSNIIPKLVGFHGQTIFHDPLNFTSIQLGNGKLLSKLLKLDVAYDFRSNDLNNGGQGAPIAPIYHKHIIQNLKITLPSIIINIGGISNITYWDGKKLLGFDAGPGNNLMDHYTQTKLNKKFDENGQIASTGRPNIGLAENYLKQNYFYLLPPKSIDRSHLIENQIYKLIMSLDPKQALATLSYITLKSITKSIDLLPQKPNSCIIVGGGEHNKYLVKMIKNELDLNVMTAGNINLPTDFIEAELIAFLSARSYYNFPITFPSTTGVKKPLTGGKIEVYIK